MKVFGAKTAVDGGNLLETFGDAGAGFGIARPDRLGGRLQNRVLRRILALWQVNDIARHLRFFSAALGGIRIDRRTLVAGAFAKHRAQAQDDHHRNREDQQVQRIKGLIHHSAGLSVCKLKSGSQPPYIGGPGRGPKALPLQFPTGLR